MDEQTKVKYEEKRVELVKVIESFENLEKSKEWEVIKELVFNPSLKSIERQILNEAVTKEINVNNLYKLQGEWAWAKQYSDTNRFIETLKKQLVEINKKIK